MNAIIQSIGGMLRNITGRLILGAALAATGAASTAQAHDDIHLDLDLGHGHADIERRHWVPGRFEERQTRVWVEPVYQTVPGERVWIEPVYRTVVDHVWREAVTRDDAIQVLVPDAFVDRDVVHGRHVHRERVLVPAHYEGRIQQTVVTPGHFEDVARQELASEGHWQSNDQQVLVTPGHFEMRIDRIEVGGGHWEEHPVIRLH